MIQSSLAFCSFSIAVVGWGVAGSMLGKGQRPSASEERLAAQSAVVESIDLASSASPSKSGRTAKSKRLEPETREVVLGEAKPSEIRDSSKESSVIMNDPFIKEKWGLARTDAKKAWEISKGSKEVVVAVIDTGIDTKHKDLACNIWQNPGESGAKANNGIDDDKNGFIDDVAGWNFVNSNNDLTDTHGHGTHIAGIIGACGGNGFGISGVAPNVSIMGLKYFDLKAPQANPLKNTISSIRYVVEMQKRFPDRRFIINYSGGGIEYSADEFAAIREAEKAGILFIAAAGNEKSNTDDPDKHYYPADYHLTNIISVTAVNRDEIKVLPSSNFGVRTVDIAAPGEKIYSTLPGNTFGPLTGTSQATAFVTGVAVLVMAHNREFNVSDVKKYILRTGDEYATLLSKTGSAKLLNSFKALTSFDTDLSFSGSRISNARGLSRRTFESEPETRDPRQMAPSALTGTDESTAPAEDLAFFGRSFLKALGRDARQGPVAARPNRARPSEPDSTLDAPADLDRPEE
jgi:subtilisin family serine protease